MLRKPELGREAAVVAPLTAGLDPAPARATQVAALAEARRTVAAHQARGEAVDEWLAGEMRLRGIRENAAVIAVLEVPAYRERTAAIYRDRYPDRAPELDVFGRAVDG